jgi:polyhydroxyalkanoate synthesis regulator phasin
MSAISRERDHGVRMIDELKERIGSLTYQIKDLENELQLAHEALKREMP